MTFPEKQRNKYKIIICKAVFIKPNEVIDLIGLISSPNNPSPLINFL